MVDKKDLLILSTLKQNSRLSSQQISRITRIPITTVHNRVKKLETLGIIKGYTLVIDHKKIGKELSAYILITVDYKLLKEKGSSQHDLARLLAKNEYVEEVAMLTGVSDIIIRVRVSNIEQLDYFVTKYLRNIDGVEKTQTMIVLSSF